MTLCLPAPAKLNLFLHITGRRSDGYHQLQTLFQLLDFSDQLTFTANRSGAITLDCKGLAVDPADNLVTRAAKRLQRNDLGAHITLQKCIPDGGGLGGGSSDAATTLVGLNHLWQLGLGRAELLALGAELGADVPVFIAGYTAWAEGIGEQLTPVELPPRWYLVIAPGCRVSTREIFSERELTRDTAPITMATFFQGASRNDCQPIVSRRYPEIANALTWLENFAPPKLTGTGGCIFAEFDTQALAQQVLQELPNQWRGFVARGLNESPLLAALAP